jgi:hypothetical protein
MMATVTFRRNNASVTVDVWASRTWQLPVTGEPGSAEIRLPYTSAAASQTYIDDDGGSWIEIASEGGCGRWVGIIRELEYSESEVRVSAAQPWVIFGDRIMHTEVTYRYTTPIGYLVLMVLREVLPGLPWFWVDTSKLDLGSDVLLTGYQFSGQDAWSVLTDLMEQALNELWIDPETGRVSWRGAMSGDLRAPAALIAGGNFRNWQYRAVGDRVSEVTVKRGRTRYSVYSGSAAVAYPGQKMITAATGQNLHRTASEELTRSSGATLTVSGGVTSDLWSIREGMFPTVVLPQAGFSGREHPCRVLARTVSDDSPLMTLGLQIIDPLIGVRVAPPMRAGSQATAGAKGKGSFAQRQRATARYAWNRWLREA